MITPAQCRAARALLEVSQEQLAVLAQVSEATVRNFEIRRRRTGTNNLKAISSALESAGIKFVGESGVTLGRSDNSPTSNGPGKMPTEVIPAKKIASDPRLEELVRRAALSQVNPDLKYEVHGANLTLTLILGRVQIKPGSDDLSLVEFQPPLGGKRDRDDHRLTNFELIRFADQCYRRRNSP